MAGENVDKIKFSVNGKDITLREGERLGNDKRKLKDLGSLWDKITQDNKLDKNELDMFKKLDQILNRNGEWNSVQMQSIAKEFEASGKEIGDFLDFKLKEKEPKAIVAKKAEVKVEPPKLEETPKAFESKEAVDEKRAKMKEERRKAELDAKYTAKHTVSENETLGLIAKKLLQDSGIKNPTKEQIMDLVNEIAEVNGIEDVSKIKVGQELRLPAEVGNVGFKSQPKTKEPTATEIMNQLNLPDEVDALIKEFKGIDKPEDFKAFAEKVDTRKAAYVLNEVFFGLTTKQPITEMSLTNNALSTEMITEESFIKNEALVDMVQKMLDRAEELKVNLGGEYTVENILKMTQDEQIGLINEISQKVIDAEPMYDINVGVYQDKDEKGNVTHEVNVYVTDKGLRATGEKFNPECKIITIDKELAFPRAGTYEQAKYRNMPDATHVVTNEGNRMKVVTTTKTATGEIQETWYVDEGRDKAVKEEFYNLSTLESEIQGLKDALEEVKAGKNTNVPYKTQEMLEKEIAQKEADLKLLKDGGYIKYNNDVVEKLRADSEQQAKIDAVKAEIAELEALLADVKKDLAEGKPIPPMGRTPVMIQDEINAKKAELAELEK